jgi:septal ring factor EnvC (AmiA/AmiB activator)
MEVTGVQALDAIIILSLAVIALAFGIKKVTKDWKLSESADSVMALMHKELERVSQQNTILSTELGKLQQEIIQLNSQLRQLCIENDKLQTEVVALTSELNAFKRVAAVRKVKVTTNATS